MAHKKFLPHAELEKAADQCAARGIASVAAGHFHAWNQFHAPKGTLVSILPAWETAGEIALLGRSGEVTCLPWESLTDSNPA